jgi:hypothetical protein
MIAGSSAVWQSKTILGRSEWQRIGNQIETAFIFPGPDFVNVNRMRGTVEALTYHGTKKIFPV